MRSGVFDKSAFRSISRATCFTPLRRRVGISIGNLTSQFFANLDDLETRTF